MGPSALFKHGHTHSFSQPFNTVKVLHVIQPEKMMSLSLLGGDIMRLAVPGAALMLGSMTLAPSNV